MHFGFLDNSKILVFISIYFLTIKCLVLGSKSKKYQKSEIAILKCAQFYVFWRLRIAFYLNLHILEVCKHLPPFDPKSWNITSLKRHFLKKISTDFSETLLEDVKLMLDKVLKVLRRYLMSFLSYRENTGGR